ncbi:dolichol-phosphate mannosyltransferase [Idiomarina sp. MD25a]|uniref:glycosyltransferase family 2 protein n=1 Tax=Idiomarina sp. MD25a TaxID=1889913 RepID=UPI0008F8CA09|nr:glycosyltransferase family 2 protein [Idiomarina sp. MD25a]OIN01885.1 dolichol-phosphate mannosyltransferase [Idiomarina sp. MD25a]
MIEFSVILPAKDEADNIGVLLTEIDSALKDSHYEVVLVDDGSSDATADKALAAAQTMQGQVSVIQHQASCGQSTALYTAAQHARGDFIVVLDADGQNDPADIPSLKQVANELQSHHFCVIGHRQQRKDTAWKRFQSRVANRFRQAVLKDDTPDTGCGLKILPRHTYLQLPYFHHMHRFVPALVKRMGGEVRSVPVNHRARLQGVSKYNAWNRAWAGLLDILGVLWLIYRSRKPQIKAIKRSQES